MLLASPTQPAYADGAFPLPRTTFGTIGLVEMPSARMVPDGELSLSATVFKNTQRYNFGFQALPWLSISFRYAGLQHFFPNTANYYDRSYGMKVRLFDEGEYRPAIAVGINDLVGTGVYGGEYIVATKRIFDNFDATVGIGWGRLAGTGALPNPFGYLFQSFKRRTPISTTGQADFKQLFHGPRVGLFGGVVWRTPIRNLALVTEYSSDAYTREHRNGNFSPATQLNFGATYAVLNNLHISVDWLYGESVAATLSLTLDPTQDPYPARIAPPIPEPDIRTAQQQIHAIEALQQSGKRSRSVADRPVGTTRLSSSAAIAEFANSVFKDDGAIQAIAFRGRTMVVSTNSLSNASAMCELYGRLAIQYLRDVDNVELSGPKNANFACQGVGADYTRPWHGIAALPDRSWSIPVAVQIGDPPTPSPPHPLPDRSAIEARIRSATAGQSIGIEAVALTQTEATVYFRNLRYGSENEAVGRLIRVLMNDAPPDIEFFHLISMTDGMPVQEYQVLRGPMERAIAQRGPSDEHKAVSLVRPDMATDILDSSSATPYPRFSWAIYPIMRESFFDPNQPVRFAFLAGASGSLDLVRGLSINANLEANLWNDFSSGVGSHSLLPHVRSDTVAYYKKGATGIARLAASYHFRLSPNVFGVVKAGYLESMFGGAGGEVLWRPEGSRLALGADLYEVWQRNFDRLFGFQPYHVTTGHVSVYYSSPWYGLNFHVMAGRYLAGDTGGTIEITRRFSTGVEIGAFATLTNVSFKKFGEGSFDKGVIIRIPLDWALPIATQTQFNLELRPLTRDGGQRLAGDTTLYYDTQRSSYGEFIQNTRDFAP